jgi:hypothetical protein
MYNWFQNKYEMYPSRFMRPEITKLEVLESVSLREHRKCILMHYIDTKSSFTCSARIGNILS